MTEVNDTSLYVRFRPPYLFEWEIHCWIFIFLITQMVSVVFKHIRDTLDLCGMWVLYYDRGEALGSQMVNVRTARPWPGPATFVACQITLPLFSVTYTYKHIYVKWKSLHASGAATHMNQFFKTHISGKPDLVFMPIYSFSCFSRSPISELLIMIR